MKDNNEIVVLIIDDSPEDRESVKRLLSNASGAEYRFMEAGTGKKGIGILKQEKPDCILLDLRLPDIDGISFIKCIEVEHGFSDIPIVLLTGHGDEQKAVDALKSGADDYMSKANLSSDVLVRAVNHAIEHKRAERELVESEEKFRKISASAFDAIIMIDNEAMISFWNEAAEKMFGYANEEAIGKNMCDFVIQERHHVEFKNAYEVFKETGHSSFLGKVITLTACRKDGTEFRADYVFSSISIDGKWHATAVIRDITAHEKLEEALRQSEKLKAIGTITSGISHEFNNILAVISGKVQLLEMSYSDNKELMDDFRDILDATNDGAAISSRMLKFTHPGQDTTDFETHDVCDLIKQSIDFTMPRWKSMAQAKGIDYQMDTDGFCKVPPILCKPTEIREVFINLVNNALDAMPEGGKLSFRTWSEDNTVVISVTDTGIGMSEDVRKCVFDPFFTTRRPEGTGLGMSVAYSVINGHKGKIKVESKIGEGSTFTIQLPPAAETADINNVSVLETDIKKPILRILVVDDEEVICLMLKDYLTKKGQKVITVNNGADAIELAKNEYFDLVLCDLVMPGMFGYDVIKALCKLERTPKIGLITGWGATLTPEEDKDLKIDFITRKPFNLSELTKQIDGIFSGGYQENKPI